MFRVLDLFSGIGGFSLGLERTGGFKTVAFCEIDPYCRKVLKKHWPDVPCYDDIRELTAERLRTDGIVADVITGGFPCQDVSLAGCRRGMDGTRSGLWGELFRLVCEIQPSHLIVENTPGLLSLGMDQVLGDLASVGFDAEWHCIPACAVGADHIRDRVWIVSYPVRAGLSRWADPGEDGENARRVVARLRPSSGAANTFPREFRDHKPLLGRGVHGIPNRVDRLRALGNAVVPQIPELIGRAILAAEEEMRAA